MGGRRLPLYLEWVGKLHEYDGRCSGLDYLLLRGEPPERAVSMLAGFRPVGVSGR